MDRSGLLTFLRKHELGVQASVGPDGAPQAAVVGIAVTDRLEIVFDTLDSTRKFIKLAKNKRISFVIGWDDESSAQIDGVCDAPSGAEADRIREAYFVAHPDGRERAKWKGIAHLRVRPTWIRFSDFRNDPPLVVEWNERELTQS